MLANEIVIPVADDEVQLAYDAAQRLSGIRQTILCVVGETSVTLTGRSEHEDLEHAWRIALLNERLHRTSRNFRSQVLAELIA